jgi:ribosome biogenesis protein BRX1
MAELKLTGNCIKGARPMLVFDESFDEIPRLKMLKELMSQTLGSPRGHPRTKPFIDHVFSFFYVDGRIWFRNYQIVYDAEANTKIKTKPTLVECGPRFVLQPVRFLSGSFCGKTLWKDENFQTPQEGANVGKKRKADRYIKRKRAKRARAAFLTSMDVPGDQYELNDVFEKDFKVDE